MRTLCIKLFLSFVFVVSMVACDLSGTPTPTVVPPPPTTLAPSTTICIDFEPPLTVGTQYGTPVPQVAGDLAFTSNGIHVHLWDFNSAFNLAMIDSAPTPFGSGQSIG